MKAYKITQLILACALMLCYSCQESGHSDETSIVKYFELGSLIDDQVAWLDSLNPKVKKLVTIDGQDEEQIDTVNWETELFFFKESDINRPYLLDTYSSQEINESNIKTTIYQPFDSTGLGVVRLAIYSDPNSGTIIKIESISKEENLLYKNWRTVTMDFSLIDGKARPITYKLEGRQKVIFKDKVDYHIQGEILY